MIHPPHPVPPPPSEEELARIEAGRRTMNYLLLVLLGIVFVGFLLGLYTMATIILANS